MTERVAEASVRTAIIGLGPRGLMVLDRLVACARRHPDIRTHVTIVEPGELGVGTHRRGQPDYLRLNTIACQLSMFPGQIEEDEEGHHGPSLYEWCLARNIPTADQQGPRAGIARPVRPADFLPRRLLGDYLAWYASLLLSLAPATMNVAVRHQYAVDVIRERDDPRVQVVMADGERFPAEHVFVTVGHGGPAPGTAGSSTRGAASPVYPLPQSIERLGDGARLGVLGIGLSAMDAMVAAIDKWGGSYVSDDSCRLRYRPSGREGSITFLTRTGLPYLGRPDTDIDRKPHEPLFLTTAALEDLIQRAGPGGLDFERDILPLMRLEMIAAYYGCCGDSAARARIRSALQTAHAAGSLPELLGELGDQYGRFDPDEHLLLQAPPLAGDEYAAWLPRAIDADLVECRRGLRTSGVKAALEVWRDLREALRRVVDGCALSARSRRVFFQTYSPMINRLVAGPDWTRLAELQSLMEAGIARVVRLGVERGLASPDEERGLDADFDLLLKGHVEPCGVDRPDSPLLSRLYQRGAVTSMTAATGLDTLAVNRRGNPISASGAADERLWVFGPPVEGASYYNHYVPSPGAPSRAYVDVHWAVKRCFGLTPLEHAPGGLHGDADESAAQFASA